MFKDIRKKPKQTRQQFAFWYAVGLTAVVAFIWVLSLQYRLDTSTLTEDGVDTHTGAFAQFLNEAKENFATAFSAFGTSTEPASEEEVAEPVATSTQFILTPRAKKSPGGFASSRRRAPRALELPSSNRHFVVQ